MRSFMNRWSTLLAPMLSRLESVPVTEPNKKNSTYLTPPMRKPRMLES
jgi:hypothetical protein